MKPTGSHSCLAPVFVVFGAALLASSVFPLIVRWRRGIPPLQDHEDTESIISRYSFIEDDYPAYYPLDTPEVLLIPEDTVHYQVSSTEADSEWAALFPPGGGFMRLGREGRPFVLTLYHQLHCLDRIRHAIGEKHSTQHVHHCFNYLRQLVLCEADATLEPTGPGVDSRSAYPTGERTCTDWEHVYEIAEKNHEATAGRFPARSDSDTLYV